LVANYFNISNKLAPLRGWFVLVDKNVAICYARSIIIYDILKHMTRYRFIGLIVTLAVISAFALPALAQPGPIPHSVCETAREGALACLWNRIVCVVVLWIFAIVIIISFIMLLVAALKFMTGGGDPKEVESARKLLTFAIVGLIVALLARVIILVVAGLLGITGGGLLTC